MSETRPLLIEIGCEELPPKSLDELTDAFANGICAGLSKRGIAADVANAKKYNSPRRLAVIVPCVGSAQPDQNVERRGPAVNAALDASGQPTKALLGFASSCGVSVDQLEKLQSDKGAWFVHRAQQAGKPVAALMQEIIAEALASLPIPKLMRWGDHDFAFVRPVHWLVVLHGEQVIDVEIFGIKSGRESRGHRFRHPQEVSLNHADEYYKSLYAANVMVSPDERGRTIQDECRARALRANLDLHTILPNELLEELVNLTEWPEPVLCRFDDEYLKIPHEALRTTMEVNQRFISTIERKAISATEGFSKLSAWFFGIANIRPRNNDYSEIRKGYERVIRPRFADAKFFYDEDLKTPLSSHQESLKTVTYQQQLGSVWDKCVRVAELSRVIANRLGIDAARATRAAALSKCDLMTRMVGEFPELQGVMGRYYATANGENADIANALDEFYRPRFAGDEIANGNIAQVLAIAERLDTLAGIFAVGMKPSGNKDPFALRRAALGLGRTLIEGNLDLDLEALLREAIELLPPIAPPKRKDSAPEKSPAEAKRILTQELLDFVFERLRGYYTEKNIGSDQFDAVRAVEPETLTDFDARIRAVADFASLPDATALAAANKRIGNILRQAGDSAGIRIDSALLDAGAERALYEQVEKVRAAIAPLIEGRRYVETLRALAALRAPVDAYFDGVMVMVDDEAKRRNRIALLNGLRHMFLQVADISVLQHA